MGAQITASGNLVSACLEQSLARPTGLAVSAAGRRLSYAELAALAGRTATWLHSADLRPSRVGILAGRSTEACAAVLGAAWAGVAFVPLSPSWPEETLAALLVRDGLDALIIDRAGAAQLSPALLAAAPARVLALHTARSRRTKNPDLPPAVEITLPSEDHIEPPLTVAPDSPACLLHSDLGGAPLGPAVVLPFLSLAHFLAVASRRYELSPDDRLAHSNDVARGGCLFSMFAALGAGASLHVAPGGHTLGPAGFIQEEAVTVWSACTSSWAGSHGLAVLQPGSLPTLRLSLFASHQLSATDLDAWHRAAPHSAIETLGGPIEAGLASLVQHVAGPGLVFHPPADHDLGRLLDGSEAAIVNAHGERLLSGQPGELAFFGPQLASGYFDDSAATAGRFRSIGGRRCFLSGIYARQTSSGSFHRVSRGAAA